jgi:hypothetical protein
MRKVSFCLSLAIVVVLGVGILVLPTAQPLQAGNAAMVANQQDCVINWSPNTYEGSGTVVLTPSGQWIYTCNAELISGPGVEKTEQAVGICATDNGSGTGNFVQNPGGQAHAGCHD